MAEVRYSNGINYDPSNSVLLFSSGNDDTYNGPASSYYVGPMFSSTGYGVRNNDTGLMSGRDSGSAHPYYVDFSSNTGVMNIVGYVYGDVLRAGSNNDSLNGGAGNDVPEGGPGGDTLNGGEGIDTLSYEHSAAPVNVGLGQTRRTDGDAVGDSATGFENVRGSQRNDYLVGDGADNVIEGGAGSDQLEGGDGTDTLSYASSAQGVTVNLSAGTSAGGDAQGDTFSGLVANPERGR